MSDFLKWFNPDGSLVLPKDAYFDSNDCVCSDVVDLIEENLSRLPADSRAVSMYYISKIWRASGTPYSLCVEHIHDPD